MYFDSFWFIPNPTTISRWISFIAQYISYERSSIQSRKQNHRNKQFFPFKFHGIVIFINDIWRLQYAHYNDIIFNSLSPSFSPSPTWYDALYLLWLPVLKLINTCVFSVITSFFLLSDFNVILLSLTSSVNHFTPLKSSPESTQERFKPFPLFLLHPFIHSYFPHVFRREKKISVAFVKPNDTSSVNFDNILFVFIIASQGIYLDESQEFQNLCN